MVDVFSIPAFFIVLREVLEACLVVGIVLAYLSKVGATQYNKWVWIGAGGGILISVIVGLVFGIIFWTSGNQVFEENAEKIFEGVTFLIAAVLLTWMIIWMMVMGKKIQLKMEQRLEEIVEADDKSPWRRKLSIFLMVFVQVLREGIETVIFLIGTVNAEDNDNDDAWRAIPLPGILAIIVGLIIAYCVFKGLLTLDIIKFFFISGIVLMAFAAGLVSHAFHELQEVDAFGPWDVGEGELRDWYNAAMWTTKECCHDKDNEFFAMLRALFGYQDTPTFIEWATYFAYWFVIAVVFVVIFWDRVRAARTKIKNISTHLACWAILICFVGWVFTLINVTWVGVLSMSWGFWLSVLTVFLVFDSLVKLIKPIKKLRRKLMLTSGLLWSALLIFMFVMHIVELECEGTEGCGLNTFFFFGIIFDPDFSELGRSEDRQGGSSWPAIAVLSVSLVVTVFFFTPLAFTIIMSSFNIDSEGDYIHDDAITLKGAAEMDGASDQSSSANRLPEAVQQAPEEAV